ncbi:transglutaminase-like domain-containing protein [Draconibacterium orientale]|uniref:transglutaminase-like domain-containing protein n=1 Tax=Draconibacterium orientale TaxID=1168034 RepID=UPI0029BFF174|nr:transglutaminase-like domain-containing protein [Draconibacterium orientale]
MNQEKLDALITLLDDPDTTVFQMVQHELLKEDEEIIPALEKKWEQSFDENSQNRIENIIQSLQFKRTFSGLKNWVNQTSGKQDIFEGFCAVDKFQYPDLNPLNLSLKIENLRKSIWLELNNSLTLLEKTTILNHFIFNLNGYSVNLSNPNSPQNCFLNQILETKRGNPVSMSIFYTIIARAIELPAYLVDFPKNPLVAIVDAELAQKVHGSTRDTEVLFYINPSNKGAITSRKEIDYHLKRNDYQPIEKYAEPKPDVLFIQRLVESMLEAYNSVGFTEKEGKIKQLLSLF